ncbi:DUF3034 family protein [Glaciecola sp. MH2013]|uniref:DUF3034 family protein n=1 Tax=Glaciecola sp. MH2013 TaxID=2785524 RepID=UPI0018A06B43|nr:DUF3034 family protein [Glaciecola sp. MH2013]
MHKHPLLFTAKFLFCIAIFSNHSLSLGAEGKLLATAGLSQVEGSGGGGLVPWATLSGYDSHDELSLSVSVSSAELNDYRLAVQTLSASFYDRVEVSVAQQRFDLKTSGVDIKQHIIGLKYKLYGDAVYGYSPQLSLGLQHKKNEDATIPNALGAASSSGTDIYFAATKVHLGAISGYNTVWNLTARATKANELGILGFGGPSNDRYELMVEASAGILLSRNLVIGVEYRQKPDNLNLGEDDWFDVFFSYIPNKNLSLTVAWTELGSIAGAAKQDGLYISLNGHL